MAAEWQELTLGDLGRIVTGKTPASSLRGAFGSDIPFVTPSDMDGRKTITTTERYLTETGVEAIKSSRLPAGAVMVSCIGSDMGKAAMAGRDCVTNQQINSIVVEDGFNRDFVYYNLSNRRYELRHQAAAGSAQPILNKRDFSRLTIKLPPLPQQKAIAAVLGALDDKIELNRRMNETLEAIAQSLFKSRFTDAAERELPGGWKEGVVGDDFDITMGQSPPGETYNESGEGLPFFQGRADFGDRFPTRRVYCTAPTRIASEGDTLVCVRAPVGDINMAAERCCIGRGLAAVRHKTGSRSYTYYAMRALRGDFDRFEAEGTVFGSMNKKDFHTLAHIVPPEQKVKDFEHLVHPLDQRIQNNLEESRTLAALRDALLPKLLSGEVRLDSIGG